MGVIRHGPLRRIANNDPVPLVRSPAASRPNIFESSSVCNGKFEFFLIPSLHRRLSPPHSPLLIEAFDFHQNSLSTQLSMSSPFYYPFPHSPVCDNPDCRDHIDVPNRAVWKTIWIIDRQTIHPVTQPPFAIASKHFPT